MGFIAPGGRRVLDTGGRVWFAISDSRVFFPGRCRSDTLYRPRQQALAGGFEARMKAMAGKAGDELATAS